MSIDNAVFKLNNDRMKQKGWVDDERKNYNTPNALETLSFQDHVNFSNEKPGFNSMKQSRRNIRPITQ